MPRSWWIKGGLIFLLVGAAVVVLVPTLIPEEHQPDFFRRHFHRRLRTQVGGRAGLRLEYEIDLGKAISMRMDSVAQGLEQILRNEFPGVPFEVERQGGTDIVVSSPKRGPELSYRNVMKAGGGWITEVERDERAGTIRLRFDPGKTAEVREATIRAAMAAIEGHMDATRCFGERLTREGDRIVLELPGMDASNAERVKAIVHIATSHPRLVRFVVVDDNPDYIRKIAAAIPPDSGIEVVTEKRPLR